MKKIKIVSKVKRKKMSMKKIEMVLGGSSYWSQNKTITLNNPKLISSLHLDPKMIICFYKSHDDLDLKIIIL
jgi:hypothetical protein